MTSTGRPLFPDQPFTFLPSRMPGSSRDPPPPYFVATEQDIPRNSTHARIIGGSEDDCQCEKCKSGREIAAFEKNLKSLFKFKTLRNLLICFFVVQFVYKTIIRLHPIELGKALISDAVAAIYDAFRLVFFSPFKLMWATPLWLFGQSIQLIQDVKAAFGFIPLFIKIALRLGGAYVLIFHIAPLLLMAFIVWPLSWLLEPQERADEPEDRELDESQNVSVAALMMLIAARRAGEEREARRRRVENPIRGRGGNRRRR